MTSPQPFANPWSVVVGSTVALIVCNGPVVAFTFGLFLKPIGQEFGWSRAATSAASAVASLMIAVAVPFAGMLIDRFGVRCILLPVIVLSSISVAAISLTPASLLVFVTLYAVTGVATAGHGPQPYAKSIAAWFDGRRGLALGIAMAGVGLGIILVPQLTRYLIETYGWRSAYVGLGGLLFAVAFPAVALFVHEPRIAHRRLDADPAAQPGLSLRETLTGPSGFWTLATAVFLAAMAVNGTVVHVVPLLTDRGLSPAVAASLLGVIGLASIAGRLLCGYLADRLFAPRVAAGFFLPCLGIGLLMLDAGRVSTFIAVVSLGLALGCEIDMMGFLTTRYFGLRRFAEFYGYLFAVFAGGSALGPFFMGLAFDFFHVYGPALAAFILALLTASLLILRLGSYVFPVTTTAARGHGGRFCADGAETMDPSIISSSPCGSSPPAP
jgi:predicted MFS family arabinose efflux permease